MEGVRVRLIDAAATSMWMLMIWFFVRGGVGELSVLHIWGLACSAIAAALTVGAIVTCAAGKVLRALHEQEIDGLMR